MSELVVLVNEFGEPTGTAEKATVHHHDTPRHLGFSCHVFDTEGNVLVTRRAIAKQTWPGVWTNAFCGHPAPEESLEDAVRRRASFELGLSVRDVVVALPDFAYRASDASGVVEHELCPVLYAIADSEMHPNPTEIAETAWTSLTALRVSLAATPWAFSPWLVEHFPLLEAHLPYAGSSAK